jgi:hypothetical protein
VDTGQGRASEVLRHSTHVVEGNLKFQVAALRRAPGGRPPLPGDEPGAKLPVRGGGHGQKRRRSFGPAAGRIDAQAQTAGATDAPDRSRRSRSPSSWTSCQGSAFSRWSDRQDIRRGRRGRAAVRLDPDRVDLPPNCFWFSSRSPRASSSIFVSGSLSGASGDMRVLIVRSRNRAGKGRSLGPCCRFRTHVTIPVRHYPARRVVVPALHVLDESRFACCENPHRDARKKCRARGRTKGRERVRRREREIVFQVAGLSPALP